MPLTLPDGRPAMDGWSLDRRRRHVNHGSYGAVPIAAQQHRNRLREEMEASPLTWFVAQPTAVAESRVAVARFLSVPAEELAFVGNASAGITTVLSSMHLAPGDDIVVTDHGYGSVLAAARRWAGRAGAQVRTARIPLDADADTAHDAVVNEFSDRTRLVIVDQITSGTARYLPTIRVAQTARARGIATLVDAAHAPGMLDRPSADFEGEYWVGNLHKFACAPRAVSALLARGAHADALEPLIDSWGTGLAYPQRFDIQGTQDLTAAIASPTSFDYIEASWGWGRARAYMKALADYAEQILADAVSAVTGCDARVDVGTPVPAMRLVGLPPGLADDPRAAGLLRDRVSAELDLEAAFTSFSGVGRIRLSTHVYNTAADYEYFAECIPVIAGWAR
ncbi:aminotransferase class V-fold PLP-dependent enzyme [Microbacterium sp. NPDC091313]